MKDVNRLIVITDEVGSVQKDLAYAMDKELSSVEKGKIHPIKRRVNYFDEQLKKLNVVESYVIKSVGDSLQIFIKTSNIVKTLLSLFEAWKSINGNTKLPDIRIVVHKFCGDSNHLIKGTTIYEGLIRNKNLEKLWPSAKSLQGDFFGLEMNLVARLATLPIGNAFLMTENVFLKTKTKGAKQIIDTDYTLIKNLENGLGNYVLSDSVPIPHLRGFDNYFRSEKEKNLTVNEQLQFLSLRQIVFSSHEFIKLKPETKIDELIFDAQAYQTFRIGYLSIKKYSEGSNEPNTDLEPLTEDIKYFEEQVKMYFENLRKSNNISFFMDFIFKINGTFNGAPLSKSRVYEDPPKSNFLNSDLHQHRSLLPKTIIFCNSFNSKGDKIISDTLRKIKFKDFENDNIVRAEYLSETNKIYKRAAWLEEPIKNCFLLLFQVNALHKILPTSFEVFSQKYYKDINANIIGCGLLQGLYDGFLILSQKEGYDVIVELDNFFSKNVTLSGKYQGIIIPNYLYELEILDRTPSNSNRQRNLLYDDVNHWKKRMHDIEH